MARRRRKPQGRKINPTLYVFCEGETEEAYINWLKTEYRLPSIVIRAKVKGTDITERFVNQYKQGRPGHAKDKTFLFYDLDVDGMLTRLQKIRDSILLVSNPAVELWFLLHCKSQTTYITTQNCCRELENRHKVYKKGLLNDKLRERLSSKRKEAVKRAKALSQSYTNPSTTVYRLIEILDDLKK